MLETKGPEPRVTVAIVPRERFSFTRQSLESVLSNTTFPHKLVYVDGGSPPEVRDYLRAQSAAQHFELIRTEHFLSPNEARNLAAARLETEFVAFVDNDVTVDPGWLEKLVACADETGAWIVGPLYMIGPPGTDVIHMAGGDLEIQEVDGRRVFHEAHRLANQRLGDHAGALRREAVDMVEFHTMLVRSSALKALGPLDEELLSAAEHADLCMLAQKQGGSVYLEPSAKVTYSPARPESRADFAYHLLRWSPEWNDRSLDRFAEKWNVERHPGLKGQARWLRRHRLAALGRMRVLDPVVRPLVTWSEVRKRARMRAG
ncbi:MAG: glycosyltransferase [Fimbriimonadaceae bacterium]|nr:glycosyltransferase family 2 protein [Chthonomonadaceae bacterium]MCO5297126.1 glycosyltransferase [Fimbriimonadaceae bacterium]